MKPRILHLNTRMPAFNKTRVELSQRERMFSLMETYFYKEDGEEVKNKKLVWQKITDILNTMGPEKDPAKWRKFWSDTLLRVRRKIILRKQLNRNGTFGDKKNTRRIEYTAEDLSILRITGGEDKLISEFKPRSKPQGFSFDRSGLMETVCLDDSNDNSSEFEIKNQAEAFYDETQNYNDDTDNNAMMQVETNLEVGEQSIHPDEKPINYDDDEDNSEHSIYVNQLPYQTENNVVNNSHPITINGLGVGYSTSTPNQSLPPLTPISVAKFNQPMVTQAYTDEAISLQRQTLTEIRKFTMAQQETNHLLRVLIERMDERNSNNNNQPNIAVGAGASNEYQIRSQIDPSTSFIIKEEN